MKDATLLLTLIALMPGVGVAAVRGDKAMYVGGTITAVQPKTMGRLDVSSDTTAIFLSEKDQPLIQIPYEKVTAIEYGLMSKRRIRSGKAGAGSAAMAVGGGVFAAPIVVPLLLTKRKNHYVTIFFTDPEGKNQACVFEVGKNYIHVTLKTLEARTGKAVKYETEDAKKQEH